MYIHMVDDNYEQTAGVCSLATVHDTLHAIPKTTLLVLELVTRQAVENPELATTTGL